MTVILALLAAAVLVVSPSGPYTSIDQAIAAANAGDTIEVRGGVYGPLVIDKSVTVRGSQGAVIDGQGLADIVRIDAPGVTLEGFELRNSGQILDREHAAVTVLASDAIVRDNVMHDVLFGVFLKEANGALVERNRIEGYPFDSARRGDGIRAWYSRDIVVRDNEVTRTRDVIFWFSTDALIARNTVVGGRYGLHFMYDDGLHVQDNVIADNSVGIFAMYSSNVVIERNLVRDSSGPSGYGIGLKEIANIEVRDNVLIRNRVGVSFDTVPHGKDAFARFERNLLAFNTVGMSFQPSTERVELIGNSYERNGSQLEVRGSGDLMGNTWTRDTGNYWSNYVGYDADRDGLGDLAYEPRSLFDSLRDRHPVLGFFNQSPASLGVDFAARAVPDLRPSARVIDTVPLMSPLIPAWFSSPPSQRWPWLAAGLGLASFASLISTLVTHPRASVDADRVVMRASVAVSARGLRKRYGETVVLDIAELSVNPGEAVALWGPNGAGKTTAIRALLGLIWAEGDVEVGGIPLRSDLRAARAQIGYVPQELDLPDLPVRGLVEFFAQLRRVDVAGVDPLLETVGLTAHAQKRPRELSGGLRQRLGLALALIGRPSMLLLDEPTANLDLESRHLIFAVLRQQRAAGVAVLFTTHRVDEVVELADRVVTLASGRVIADEGVGEFTAGQRLRGGLLLRVSEADVSAARDSLERMGVDVQERGGGWLVVSSGTAQELLHGLAESGATVLDMLPRGDT